MSAKREDSIDNNLELVEKFAESIRNGMPASEIPLDYPRSDIQSFFKDQVTLELDTRVTGALFSLSSDHNVPLPVVLCGALEVVLHRYTGQSAVIIGALDPQTDSSDEPSNNALLPLYTELEGDPDISEVLTRTMAAVENARGFAGKTLYQWMEDQALEDTTRAPLFQVMMLGMENDKPLLSDVAEADRYREQIDRCDVVLSADITADRLVLHCEYDTDLIEEETAERLLGHLASVLEGFTADQQSLISRLPLLTAAERSQLLFEWNDTSINYPQSNCLHHLFEKQVAATPDAVALVFNDERLTYDKLNRHANRLANWLRNSGVSGNDLVGVFMQRSLDMVIAVYGALKAGAAYVPLDPEYPAERLAMMLQESAAPVILTQQALLGKLPAIESRVLCLDRDRADIELEQDVDPTPLATIDDLAYVIFTSGSTGKPKGVMNCHRGICNRILWMQSEYGLGADDAVLQKTPLSFDVSVWELFWPLITGARLVLAAPGDHRDPGRLVELIKRNEISTLHFVPSMLQLFVDQADTRDCASIRRVFCSGEALPYELQEQFFSRLPDVALHNLYGPTEAAVDVSYWKCQPGDSRTVVPIGRPVANTQLYILDTNMEPVPVGVPGELHIGGVQVATGYLNRQDLTDAAFVADPFTGTPGGRLYKTGDLARFLADGSIEFLGRIDHQIKLRGLRIELGEIETRLRQHPSVKEGLVLLREDVPGDKRLVAYLTLQQITRIDTADIAGFLRQTLPEYMIPSPILVIEAMPLGPSGKIDRQALPAPTTLRRSAPAMEPGSRSRTEAKIADIWAEVLGLEQIGLDENFFDIGGHSLLVVKVRTRIGEMFDCELTVAEMFRYPTVRALAERLERGASAMPAVDLPSTGPANSSTEIAVIGMACRLPGAEDVDAFWENIKQGVESISFFTDDQLLQAGVPQSDLANPNYVKARAVLQDADLFDAGFFGYSPREAEVIDPQQRIFLESAWHAMEDAGYGQQPPGVSVGVYAGAGMNTYLVHNLHRRATESGVVGAFQVMISNDKDFLPTRVSYKLDLKGPSINIQTACSTSLVAVHTACRALIEGECQMAIAGGATVHVPQTMGYQYQDGMILSSDGHCKAFDAKANGTVFGSGVAVVVLKQLEQALADGDNIHAVIKGSAINNDGSLKIGYTAPSVEGQSSVITNAQTRAGVSPETIGYVEAHGTGTSLGDPVEIEALTQAFRRQTQKRGFCGIGSVKTNIGHVDAAAGATGLIKTILAIKHKTLPPSLHFESPNPAIDFDNSPFYVVREAGDWVAGDLPRRAGVSSFGIGGTNAHVVLEEAPPTKNQSPATERDCHLLTMSAKNEQALDQLADRFAAYLRERPDVPLGDLCFTANAGRSAFEQRLAVVAEDSATLLSGLKHHVEGNSGHSTLRGPAKENGGVAFLFTGQGAQRIGMGRELYRSAPVFRAEINRCAEILDRYLDHPLLPVMFEGLADDNGPLLDDTRYTQPAMFALEYALARLWQSWGVEPDMLIGHSVGEYAAACVAGVFSLEDGIKLISGRGRLMSELPRDGDMRVVFATESEVRTALSGLEDQVSLAGVNGPASCVISGDRDTIQALADQFESKGFETRDLNVSHAFHSPLMEPMLAAFREIAEQVSYSPPQLGLVSNVSGRLAGAEVADAEYWCRHIREPVQFASGMKTLAEQGIGVYLETGPHPTLVGMGRACIADDQALWLTSLRKGTAEWCQILESLGSLYTRGLNIDWLSYDAPYSRQRLSLPTYPFQRQRHWVEESEVSATQYLTGQHPLLGRRLGMPLSQEVRFETVFSLNSPSYVKDHRVFGVLVVAGASHCAMLLLGAQDLLGSDSCTLEDIYFLQPFTLSENGARQVQLIAAPPMEGKRNLQLVSLKEDAAANHPDNWVQHLRATLCTTDSTEADAPGNLDIDGVRERCHREMPHDQFYQEFWVQGPDAGPAFRWIEHVWMGNNEAIARTAFPGLADDPAGYQLHPGIIEACFQVLRACREFESQQLLAEGGHIYVPFSIGRFTLYRKPAGTRLWCHALIRSEAVEQSVVGDLLLIDESGEILAAIDAFECRRLPRETLLRNLQTNTREWLYEKVWQAEPLAAEDTAAAGQTKGNWLLFADRQGVGSEIQKALEAQGANCSMVLADKTYQVDANGNYRLNPLEPADFHKLITDLSSAPAASSEACPLQGVLHLWGIDPIDQTADGYSDLAHALELGSGSSLHLVQSLVTAGWERLPSLYFATKGVQPAGGRAPVQVEQAPIWGLARVLVQEHPELHCACVDIGPEQNTADIQALLREIRHQSGDDQVALRDGQRYAARLVRYRMPARPSKSGSIISNEATYLITGGPGGLGLRLAAWLVEQGARHLVLTSRNGITGKLPPELAVLQHTGTEIRVEASDIANPNDLAGLLANIRQTMPPLAGVIHAAGVLDDGMLLHQDWSRFRQVYAPKVQGTWNLHRQTADAKLDFFVCFSSASALLGAPGQANYAAANAYMDALMQYRRARGLPGLSVSWGPWAEAGMAASMGERERKRAAEQGWGSIDPELGMNILGDLLQTDSAGVGVLPLDWGSFASSLFHGRLPGFLARWKPVEISPQQSGTTPAKRDAKAEILAAAPTEREELLRDYVVQVVAGLLGHTELDPQQGFAEMGMDSLMGVNLRELLQSGLGLSLSSTFAFDYSNIQDVVDYLGQLLFPEQAHAGPADEGEQPGQTTLQEKDLRDVDIDESIAAELAALESKLDRQDH